MPTCFFVKHLLSDYLDGVVDQRQQRQIQDHFQECTNCHAILNDLRALQSQIQALPLDVLPPEVDISADGKWYQRLDPRPWSPWKKYLFEGVLLLGLATLIIGIIWLRWSF